MRLLRSTGLGIVFLAGCQTAHNSEPSSTVVQEKKSGDGVNKPQASKEKMESLGTAECYVVIRPAGSASFVDIQWSSTVVGMNTKLTLSITNDHVANMPLTSEHTDNTPAATTSPLPMGTTPIELTYTSTTPPTVTGNGGLGQLKTVPAYTDPGGMPLFHILRFGESGEVHRHDILIDYKGRRVQLVLGMP